MIYKIWVYNYLLFTNWPYLTYEMGDYILQSKILDEMVNPWMKPLSIKIYATIINTNDMKDDKI